MVKATRAIFFQEKIDNRWNIIRLQEKLLNSTWKNDPKNVASKIEYNNFVIIFGKNQLCKIILIKTDWK